MPAYVYNSSRVIVTFGGKVASGLADGDFFKVTFAEDFVMRTMGTDGLGCLSMSLNESADFELSLLASSPFNDYLSAVFQTQRTGVLGLPLLVRDTGGTSLHTAAQAYISKMPDKTYSRSVATIVWSLGTTSCVSFIGSNGLAAA